MKNPKITIILPTYNRAHVLKETLDSISNQSYINWECLVINDFSTDATSVLVEKYVQEDPRFLFYSKEKSTRTI